MVVRLNFHADGRKIRSERRDGIGMLLVALVLRMDLATGRMGFPTENGFSTTLWTTWRPGRG